jgi:GT2 family glycosyltransferase
MDFSIVMPVFNREDLTHNCLATLVPTLEGAGSGEVIVVDNGSRPETAEVLAAFPWVRVIRNATNLGFAAACNQGARAASGRLICHLNNDIVARPGWLAAMIARLTPDVGIVGARLLFPDNTLQHAGVAIYPVRFGVEGIGPYHVFWKWRADHPMALERADFQIVTGACLLTPRELFLELGGFDEIFWNGYEDVDYCLRVGERGLRVVYEPSAVLVHYESQSGVQRKRRLTHNLKSLGSRWGSKIRPDQNLYWAPGGCIRRETITCGLQSMVTKPLPPTTVIVHGDAPDDPAAFLARLLDARIVPEAIWWCAAGPVPRGAQAPAGDPQPVDAVRALLATRGDRYFAFVHTATSLCPGWLDRLESEIEYGGEVVAATVADGDSGLGLEPCAADGRCTLINLRMLPHHVRVGEFDTVDAALVDLTIRAVALGLGVRSVPLPQVRPAPPQADAAFVRVHGASHDELRRPDIERMERLCADPPPVPTFASIVMLSWNAPQFTKMAVDSIRAYTRSPHEIIIIDNGSGPETVAMLRDLTDVRVIYNATNTGFAHGCNQGIAAASGTHVVLLNNDVIVTDGWLESLLDVQRRDPLVGVSAPRSNKITGHQQVAGCTYTTEPELHEFAAQRRRTYARDSYRTDRAIGFCLCIARSVVEEVGGIDERYGLGNFEDDDFCIRVRAAGYQIAICEDSFVHHFGSATFAANKVDYSATMAKNWALFAARWGLPETYPEGGYNALPAIERGFIRARDYVALPREARRDVACAADEQPRRSYETAFVAVVDGDAAWSRVGPLVSNYVKTLCVDDSALFAIGVMGDADAVTIGARIARSIDRLKLANERVADVDVADVMPAEFNAWLAAIPATSRLRVANDERLAALAIAPDRSPSGFARTVRGKR